MEGTFGNLERRISLLDVSISIQIIVIRTVFSILSFKKIILGFYQIYRVLQLQCRLLSCVGQQNAWVLQLRH